MSVTTESPHVGGRRKPSIVLRPLEVVEPGACRGERAVRAPDRELVQLIGLPSLGLVGLSGVNRNRSHNLPLDSLTGGQRKRQRVSLMKSGVKFLTSLTALCLFGGVASWAEQNKQFAQTAPGKQTKSATRSDAIPLGTQVDVQKQDAERARSRVPSTDSQSGSVGIHKAPFLKHPLLFGPNSLEMNAESRDMVKRAASWLREHREARILVVGFCDPSGSETCTHTLAEGRGLWFGSS